MSRLPHVGWRGRRGDGVADGADDRADDRADGRTAWRSVVVDRRGTPPTTTIDLFK